ncbi:hypothetical protein PspLS_06078, partial [Pyricularia sp. CBS 133598]
MNEDVVSRGTLGKGSITSPGSLAQRNTICNTASDTRTKMRGGLGGT